MSPIALTDPELDEFMLSSPRGILCVSRSGRAPLALPMWFGWMDGKIVMTTLLSSKKVLAVRDNPQVSFLVESGREYFTLKAVLFSGHCEIIEDHNGVGEWMGKIQQSKPLYKELFPKDLPSHLERHYQKPHAALVITPSSVTSWDFAKVRV